MKNATTVAGEQLVLRCYVSGYPIHSITWSKGQHFPYHVVLAVLVSPLARHRDTAGGLMFCLMLLSFLIVAPCHSTTGGRIATRIVALTPLMKSFYG